MRAGSKSTVLLVGVVAALSFALGGFVNLRRAKEQDARIEALRAEMASFARDGRGVAGTSGAADDDAAERSRLIDELKAQLKDEMGLMPISLLRARGESFVELYAKDNFGHSNYGTAGYLGDGYFITVKHAVVALGPDAGGEKPRSIDRIELVIGGKRVRARLVDAGDADMEVDPGDWAIVKVAGDVALPALSVDLDFPWEFAEPIVRLGNDYSKGIVLSSGYIGQRLPNRLVTSLTDGHPGVSGGGVLNQEGEIVGIPVGRMQGDYRFSFILPLRAEMFRRVPALAYLSAPAEPDATPSAE